MMDEKNDFLKVDEEQGKKKAQSTVVIVLAVAIAVFAVVLTVVLVKALFTMSKTDENTTIYEMTSNHTTTSATDEGYINSVLNIDNSSDAVTTLSDSITNEAAATVSEALGDILTETTKNQLIESYEALSVNGENLLSDHCDNEFIKLVSDTYAVDPDLLVAIYSVPDSGTNFVLQFNGDKKRGEFVKSPDTLEKVYQIDAQRNIKVATGKVTGNEGVSYAESVMCVAMVKTIVMEQYPNYFTGLEG